MAAPRSEAFRLEDMPRVTERDREILRRVLYILREAERFCAGVRSARVAPSSEMIWAPRRARLRALTPSRGTSRRLRRFRRRNCGELEVPRPREWALSDFGDTMTTEAIRARFDLRRDDGVFFCVFSRVARTTSRPKRARRTRERR